MKNHQENMNIRYLRAGRMSIHVDRKYEVNGKGDDEFKCHVLSETKNKRKETNQKNDE